MHGGAQRARARPSGRGDQRTLAGEHRRAIHRSRRTVRRVGERHPAGEFRAGFGVFFRCPVPQTAVRPLGVVFFAPALDFPARIVEIGEPVRVETFVAESSVEALHVPVGLR